MNNNLSRFVRYMMNNLSQFVRYMTARGRGGIPVWVGYLFLVVIGLSFLISSEFANEMNSFGMRNGFNAQKSPLASLFSALGFIGGPVIGLILLAKGRELLPWNRILYIAIGVEVVCGVVIGITQDFAIICIVRTLQGAVQATLAGLGVAAIGALFDSDVARKLNAWLQPSIALGVAIGLNVPGIAGSIRVDWPIVIMAITVLIGVVEAIMLKFIPDIRPLMAAAQLIEERVVQGEFRKSFVVFALLGGGIQQILVNGLFSHPEAALNALGHSHAQVIAGVGGNMAFAGAVVAAILASFVAPKWHFPISVALLAFATIALGYGFLVNGAVLEPSYYAFAFCYNLGVGTLAAPLTQEVQNDATRQMASGVFIVSQGFISAGFAYVFLPLLNGAPTVLFFGSAIAITTVGVGMTVMYQKLTKPQQAPAPIPVLAPVTPTAQLTLQEIEAALSPRFTDVQQNIQQQRALLQRILDRLQLIAKQETTLTVGNMSCAFTLQDTGKVLLSGIPAISSLTLAQADGGNSVMSLIEQTMIGLTVFDEVAVTSFVPTTNLTQASQESNPVCLMQIAEYNTGASLQLCVELGDQSSIEIIQEQGVTLGALIKGVDGYAVVALQGAAWTLEQQNRVMVGSAQVTGQGKNVVMVGAAQNVLRAGELMKSMLESDPGAALSATKQAWQSWLSQHPYQGPAVDQAQIAEANRQLLCAKLALSLIPGRIDNLVEQFGAGQPWQADSRTALDVATASAQILVSRGALAEGWTYIQYLVNAFEQGNLQTSEVPSGTLPLLSAFRRKNGFEQNESSHQFAQPLVDAIAQSWG